MTVIKMPAVSVPSSSGVSVLEIEISPEDGSQHVIPETDALIINVLLSPVSPMDELQIILPASMLAGRRLFIYSDNSVGQLTVTSGDPDAEVVNNIASMNMNDLIVFNTVSTTKKLWARVVTS